MAVNNFNNFHHVAYGLSDALLNVFNPPIVSQRAPSSNDTAPIGTLWVNKPASDAFILVNILAGQSTWQAIGGGGAGVFSSLTVTPGPISLTGTTNINTVGAAATSIGTGGTGVVNIGNATGGTIFTGTVTAGTINGGAVTATSMTVNPGPTNLSTVGNGAVTIGNATNTGAITMSVGTGNLSINGNAHGISIGSDAAANVVTLGSTTAGALTSVLGGNGTGVGSAGLLLQTANAGDIQVGNLTQTGTVYLGVSATTGPINIGGTSTGSGTITIGGGTAARNINIGTSAVANQITIGNSAPANKTFLLSPVTVLPGPIQVLTGAGAPSNGLALEVGDLYINTTAASAVTRMYIATAPGAWTNVTCAA